MSVVGRFEILSPIFSGALQTSTARDPQTGDTVLVHVLPPGHEQSPREFFSEIAPDWPGEILHAGFDIALDRTFVVTEYPKDRKAFRLLINRLSALTVPGAPAESDPRAAARSKIAGEAAATTAQRPPASASAAAQYAADILAFFKAQTAPTKPAGSPATPVPASNGAIRLFDPSAVFASATANASPALVQSSPAQASPAPDGATRLFDPSAIFGNAATAPAPSAPHAAPTSSDGATRIFDPSAVFGAAAPVKPAPPAASGSSTRIFDPSAVFGAPAPKTKVPSKEEEIPDSSKRAAEDFISGRLSPEFRDAPTRVQRSLEELLGRKVDEPHVEPTPGRPGVITLMFDSYGRRIDHADPNAEQDLSPAPSGEPSPGTTKMISSADLSAYFAADAVAGSAPQETRREEPPRESSPRQDKK